MEGLHKWPGQAMVLYTSFFQSTIVYRATKVMSVLGVGGGGGR